MLHDLTAPTSLAAHALTGLFCLALPCLAVAQAVWTPAPDVEARSRHAMAYHAGRQVVLLLGGEGSQGVLADAWEWDGSAWRLHAPLGPLARSGHAMA